MANFTFTHQTFSKRSFATKSVDFKSSADMVAYIQNWFKDNRNEIRRRITDGTGNITRILDATVAPVLAMTLPAGSSSAPNANVSYTLSKDLVSGTITWTRTGGTADPSSPHVQNLSGSELTANQTNHALNSPPTLVSGTVYTVTFNGVDLAGKPSNTVTVTAVTKS